jgi:hypothetical protein
MSIGPGDQWLSGGAGYGRNLQAFGRPIRQKRKLFILKYLTLRPEGRARIFVDFRSNRL